MKIALTIIAAATIIAGGQLVQSDPGRANPSTNRTQPTGEDRGLWGACCLEDGSCVMEYGSLCFSSWGGTYMGGECADNPCPDPIGACCNSGGMDCELYTEPDCEMYGGYWQGGATNCESAGCTMEPWGSCCLPYGGCESMTMYECDQYYPVGEPPNDWDAGDNWQAYTTCEEADCAPTCGPTGFFDNIAYPLTVGCQNGSFQWPSQIYEDKKFDLNGDNAPESIMQTPSAGNNWEGNIYTNKGLMMIQGENPGTVDVLNILDLSPDALTYSGYTWDGEVTATLIDFLDVTGDGVLDAIIKINETFLPGEDPIDPIYFYVTNISTPPGITCATDINNDDVTDTSDLLALIAGWGPCTQ